LSYRRVRDIEAIVFGVKLDIAVMQP
jgi:hypothetical protein